MDNNLVLKSEIQNRALKLRIYLNEEQEILINKTFGCARKVYNYRISEKQDFYNNIIKPEEDKQKRKELWKTARFMSVKELKVQFPYLSEPTAQSLSFAVLSAEQAYTNFLQSLTGKRKGKRVGLPKFKSRKTNDFSYKECMVSKSALNRGNKTIKIPKLGEVKYRKHNKINDFFTAKGAVLKSITVRKNPAGEYFAVLLYERPYVRKSKTFSGEENKTIGLDFSPAELYIDSNGDSGKKFGYIAQKQANKKQLKKLQRRLMKKQKGSNNRNKARIKVARLENRISNKRLDFIEKESLRLVRFYELIGVEDLNLQGMMKFSRNAKNYTDTSWATFVTKLIWKASKNENNCQVVKADRFFPSSQLCSHCGFQKRDLKLSDRKWVCPKCGIEHSRDKNAAVNIKQEAKKQLNIPVASRKFKSTENYMGSGERLAALALTA